MACPGVHQACAVEYAQITCRVSDTFGRDRAGYLAFLPIPITTSPASILDLPGSATRSPT